MKRPYLAALSAAVLALAGSAEAQRGPGGPPMMGGPGRGGFGLLEFDANNDGKLTKAEFDGGLKARFTELDANKDGFVTPEEMRAGMMKRHMEARFAELDADHNGQISKAEFEAGMPKPGADGGPPEGGGRFRGPPGFGGPGMHGPVGPEGFGRHGRHGPGGPDGRDGPDKPGQTAGNAAHVRPMGPADANKDGRLSYEEFAAHATAAFTHADTDKNGVVTIAELRASAGSPR